MPSLPAEAHIALAPDWVCEVLTPAIASFDRVKKLRGYAGSGVSFAWLIDPAVQTLEVLRLDDSRWALVSAHEGGEVVRAEPFAELALEPTALWSD